MLAVLAGALLHAAWNVAIRAGGDRRRETALLAIAAAAWAAAALPFLSQPLPASWPNLIVTAALHGVYYALIAEAYARGGVALAYPIMRGSAPMLTTLGAWMLLGERLPPLGWAGIGGICAGVVMLARPRGGTAGHAAVPFALANAVVIAAYTVNDAIGARASSAPFAYALWTFLLSVVPTALWLGRFGVLRTPTAREAVRAAGGAACSIGSYGLALWAMTRADVAPVAALRETAMLFGIVLARVVLGERPGARGWAAAGAIAAGAAVLRLA
jgi:drug/metabolite transporter (DMT)-like permease